MTVRAGPPLEVEEASDDDEERTPTPAELELQRLRDEIVNNQRRTDSQQLEGEPILRELSVAASNADDPDE